MNLTFLGHQGWMFSEAQTNLLIDPILTEHFGTNEQLKFWIYPNRKIDVAQMPRVDAIIISCEHIQHFHLPSLLMMESGTPVFIGFNTPYFIEKLLNKYGFNVKRVELGKKVIIGDLSFSFYAGHENTVSVDSRTHSLVVTTLETEETYIFQSDTQFSINLIENIKNEKYLSAIICTNNFQLRADGEMGFLANLLPIENNENSGLIGLEVMFQLLIKNMENFPFCKNIIINGNGYTTDYSRRSMFKWQQSELADFANKLSFNTQVHGPHPGDLLCFKNVNFIEKKKVNWITLIKDVDIIEQRDNSITEKKISFEPKEIFSNLFNSSSFSSLKELIISELNQIARVLLFSDFGYDLVSFDKYLHGNLGAERFLIHFICTDNHNDDLYFSYDISQAKFVEHSIFSDEYIKLYPFGIMIHMCDFIAILEGKIQFWEIATCGAIKQWYVNSSLNSPVFFLLKYYSEEFKQNLAYMNYENSVEKFKQYF